MLSAHMDTAGFLATHIDDYGFVRFGLLGDIGLDAMQNANVVFINDVRGVVSCDEKVERRTEILKSFILTSARMIKSTPST